MKLQYIIKSKKFNLLLLVVLMFSILPISKSYATPSELLSGESLNIINWGNYPYNWNDVNAKPILGATDKVTDGSNDTFITLGKNENSSANTLIFTFREPKTITGYRLLSSISTVFNYTTVRISLFKSDGQRITLSYPHINTGSNITLDSPITDITHVELCQTGSAMPIDVYEFNLLGESTIDPVRSQLVVRLVSGLEKKYDLSAAEIDSFISWYNNRAAAVTSSEKHTIDEEFNKTIFLSIEDNIAFDKIEAFEINEYTPAP